MPDSFHRPHISAPSEEAQAALANRPESPLFETAKEPEVDRGWVQTGLVTLAAVAITLASLWCLTAMGIWYH